MVTLPESQEEAGGERGREALETLERLFGRIEAIWEPLAVNEAFEVVSRRLFGEIRDPSERDRTSEAFSRLYSSNRRNYPRGAGAVLEGRPLLVLSREDRAGPAQPPRRDGKVSTLPITLEPANSEIFWLLCYAPRKRGSKYRTWTAAKRYAAGRPHL